MNRIKKGDEVIVNAGKDRGRRGVVLEVYDNDRVLVEGVNIVKKHQKANPNNPELGGGIMDRAMPVDTSNVMLYNPITKKGDRVGFKHLEDGTKVRIFKSNGEVVDV